MNGFGYMLQETIFFTNGDGRAGGAQQSRGVGRLGCRFLHVFRELPRGHRGRQHGCIRRSRLHCVRNGHAVSEQQIHIRTHQMHHHCPSPGGGGGGSCDVQNLNLIRRDVQTRRDTRHDDELHCRRLVVGADVADRLVTLIDRKMLFNTQIKKRAITKEEYTWRTEKEMREGVDVGFEEGFGVVSSAIYPK